MTHNPLVGRKFRHKKRGSEYVVLTETFNDTKGLQDGQNVFLWGLCDGSYYHRISPENPELDSTTHVVMRLPFTMQISGELSDYDEIVIYQCLTDNRIWGRPKEEFLDGRFEEIE